MIVWRGRGVLVAVIAFVRLLLTELITRQVFHDNSYYQGHGWPKLLAFLCAAGLIWLLLRRPSGSAVFRQDDALFHIRIKHWPLILSLLGIVFYFVRG
jgi:hypothetical protein